MALLYVAFSVVYILAPSHVAALWAQSVEQVEQLERIKGVAFVLGTGACFGVSLPTSRRDA